MATEQQIKTAETILQGCQHPTAQDIVCVMASQASALLTEDEFKAVCVSQSVDMRQFPRKGIEVVDKLVHCDRLKLIEALEIGIARAKGDDDATDDQETVAQSTGGSDEPGGFDSSVDGYE